MQTQSFLTPFLDLAKNLGGIINKHGGHPDDHVSSGLIAGISEMCDATMINFPKAKREIEDAVKALHYDLKKQGNQFALTEVIETYRKNWSLENLAKIAEKWNSSIPGDFYGNLAGCSSLPTKIVDDVFAHAA